VDFYTLHHNGIHFNAINQRYWLQYYLISNIATATSSSTAHFIRPFDMSEAHATKCKLVPFQRWLNLAHTDTYINGPFVFATANGHKTQDCISQTNWDALATQNSMFHNLLPWFDCCSYSIHADRGINIIFNNSPDSDALLAAVSLHGKMCLYP
jgi:hypothetical protein